jgi:hypothetical protein
MPLSRATGFLVRHDAAMFRISRDEQEPVAYVASEDGIVPHLRAAQPGRYHIGVISTDHVSPGDSFRRWGIGIKRADGLVTIEADPLDA